ncbi:anti-sigma factor family protein [Streptomyces sp. NPDC090994]|uniref:anti-sigma factor family protein n=1 Tax=Streptomyces sp. NPDC090994 TaxID=3365969 RepID=UPI003820998F
MARHPDVAEISDLAEGLLPPAQTADVRRHLDACELCADVYASLEEIQGLLGTLPGPPRMPDDVAGRIDAALAAEALLAATAPEPTHPDAHGAPVPLSEGSEDRSRVSRETSVAVDRPAGRAATSTTGPGRKKRTRDGRRRIAALGAVFAVAALGLGSVIVSSLDSGDAPGDAGQPSALADTFSEGKLGPKVADLLADDQPGQSTETSSAQSFRAESETGAENRVFTQPAVPSCIRQGIGREDAALATEEGIYQGHEVLLVILPDAADAGQVTAYLVETACVAQPSLGAGEVLLESSYPRP